VGDAERVHQMAKQQEQDTSDSLLKQGIAMSQKGQLTGDWVLGHSASLEPSAMKYLLDEAAGKRVDSDIRVYSSLLDRAVSGQDVREDANNSLFSGMLSKEDYTRITEISGRERPNWFKRGDDFIKTAGQPSQFNFDPARNITLANMRNEWQDWANSHPNADGDQAEKEYTGIVRRYQLVDGSQNIFALPVPQYLQGARTAPDLQATKRATVEAFYRGEISKAELDKQATLLNQWETAIQNANQRAAKARQQP
jgi:hypothetical protein